MVAQRVRLNKPIGAVILEGRSNVSLDYPAKTLDVFP